MLAHQLFYQAVLRRNELYQVDGMNVILSVGEFSLIGGKRRGHNVRGKLCQVRRFLHIDVQFLGEKVGKTPQRLMRSKTA